MLQVKAYGPGLKPTGVTVNKPTEFTIDARMAGKGQLKIYAQVRTLWKRHCLFILIYIAWGFLDQCWLAFVSTKDAEGCTINIKITDKGDGTFLCVYTPVKPIKHTIIITWGEVNVPNSPFRVRHMMMHMHTPTTALKVQSI